MTEQVVIPEGLAHNVIGKCADPNDWKWDDSFDEEKLAWFNENFEVLSDGAPFLGDPGESWYQGVSFTAVIRRKSDGKLFGYPYWEVIAKHGEPYYEGNGDDFGLHWGDYVFLPVREFTVIGYEVVKETDDGHA